MATTDRGESWRHDVLVQLPTRARTASGELGTRCLLGAILFAAVVAVVFVDRGGYLDNVNHDGVSFIDALYYSAATITMTGYGDITPVTPTARILSVLVVTPLRIAFLVLLVITTLEVLANEGRRAFRDAQWRKRMRGHTIIVGYGTKGRSAVKTLLHSGLATEKLLVVDNRFDSIAEALRTGLAGIEGDAVRRDVLLRAEVAKAKDVIVTLDRDDSAILVTLTVRQINPGAHIVVAVQNEDNVPLLRQSGADIVVTSSDAVGRLMGLSTVSPQLGHVLEDLLSSGEGLEVAQRLVTPAEVGRGPGDVAEERVIAVVRRDVIRRFFDSSVQKLETGDQLIVVRRSEGDRLQAREAAARAAAERAR